MEGGENGLTWKSFENIFSSQNIEFSFFKRERLLELFFLSLFSMLLFLFFLCSVSLLRMNSGIFEMCEEKTIFFKLSFKWDRSGYTKIYEIGGVAEKLSALDAYSGMDLCTPKKCLGEASSKISCRKNHFEKFKSSRRTYPLTKLNKNKSCYVEYI
jgi:hypothetical protein